RNHFHSTFKNQQSKKPGSRRDSPLGSPSEGEANHPSATPALAYEHPPPVSRARKGSRHLRSPTQSPNSQRCTPSCRFRGNQPVQRRTRTRQRRIFRACAQKRSLSFT